MPTPFRQSRRALVVMASVYSAAAWALTDNDGDGYSVEGSPADCDDDAPSVNPGANEHPNETDDDCDESLGIRRDFVADFESGTDWTVSSGSISGGELVLEPPSPSVDATATMNETLDWTLGRFTVHVDVDDFDGATCWLEVSESGSATVWTRSLTIGTSTHFFTDVAPGDTIDLLRIRCQGGAATDPVIDWLTVSNGQSYFAPIADVETDALTMSFPTGERQTFLRVFGTRVYTGSDVGGFAYSEDDGESWTAENGGFDDFKDPGDLGVWDAWNTGDDDLFVLTGEKDSGLRGGIWRMNALDGNFEELDLSPYELGFSKHFDECATKSYSSGKLVVSDEDYADDNFYVLSQADGDRGIYLISNASTTPTVCQPYDPTSLPEGAVPRAAAIVGTTDRFLVVGYGARYLSTDASDPGPGLYACPLVDPGACVDFDEACTPIDDGDPDTDEEAMDVRDIELHPEDPHRFYVADGGVRLTEVVDEVNQTTTISCAAGHSTVMAVDLAGASTWQVWDTDTSDTPATTNVPVWAYDDTTSTFRGYDDYAIDESGCATGGTDLKGDLVGFTAGAPIVSVAVAPWTGHIFAFYNASSRNHACVTAFRAVVPTEFDDPDTLLWKPLMYYGDWDDSLEGTGAAERRSRMNANGAWFGDTDGDGDNESPLIELRAQSVHDATFTPDTASTYRLLMGSQFQWWIPVTGTSVDHDNDPTTADISAVGWNAPYTSALDGLYFEHGWSPVHSFQDTGMQAIAAHVGSSTTPDVVYQAIGDWGMSIGYGSEAESTRHAADRPCQIDGLGTGGYAVSTWQAYGDEEVWYGLRGQGAGAEHDESDRRFLLYNDGSAWCWDGVESRSYGTRLDDASGAYWELTCADEEALRPDLTPWTACNSTATVENDAFGMDDIGNIQEIEAIGPGVALIAAWGACDSTYRATSCPTGSGAGLWVATRTATGMTYEQVEFDETVLSGCTELQMFEGPDGRHALVDIAVAPDTDTSVGTVHAYVSSSECGVFEVSFDLATPTVTTWDHVWTPDDPDDCAGNAFSVATTLNNGSLEGIELSLDGNELLVYGGEAGGASEGGGICVFDVSAGGADAPGTTVVTKDEVVMFIDAVRAHPWIEGLYAFGGYQTGSCTTCSDPGVYLLEKQYDPATATDVWSFEMVSSDDLEARLMYDFAWGVGAGAAGTPLIDHLYVSSGGQGPWDLKMSW